MSNTKRSELGQTRVQLVAPWKQERKQKSHYKGRQGSCSENKLSTEASGQHIPTVASHPGGCKIWWDSDSVKREWKGGSSICMEQIVKLQKRKHERTRCYDSFTQALKYLVQNAKY